MAGEIQWLAGRCRPELMYATNLLSQAISRCPKEAVYRGGHLVRYLKRYPKGGLWYPACHVRDQEARRSCEGPLLEGYSDASFAPTSERSQQCVVIFAAGGLIAWSSSQQPFITMSTAESELVAICELATCLKSVEQLMAEVALGRASDHMMVTKVIYSDSQAALSVCRCSAGSWRTRHLRIRGGLVRELLDQSDWDSYHIEGAVMTSAGSWRTRHLRIRGGLVRELLDQSDWDSYHIEGAVMTADVGTKALGSDRFNMLVDRMRMSRTRCCSEEARSARTLSPQLAKRLVLILCVATLVDRVEAADEPTDYVYYGFMTGVLLAILFVYELVKWCMRELWACCAHRTGRSETGRGDSPSSSSSEGGNMTESLRAGQRRRPPAPPVPEPRVELGNDGAYSFSSSSGDRDRWEIDYERNIAIRHHPRPRQLLFVPGHCSGGPELSWLTGERRTYARFANGQALFVHGLSKSRAVGAKVGDCTALIDW
eukprot:s5040_g16.t1